MSDHSKPSEPDEQIRRPGHSKFVYDKAKRTIVAVPENPVLEAERSEPDDQTKRIVELEQRLENERMKVAGCSTAALGHWKEGDTLSPDYECPAIRDVASLYQKYIAAETALQAAREGMHWFVAEATDQDAYVVSDKRLVAEAVEKFRVILG